MIARVCSGAAGKSCGRIIDASSRRCEACSLAYNRTRGSSHKRGYTSRWRRVSERQRREVPWCQIRYPGCTGLAEHADHVTSMSAGGKSVRSNVQSACAACNARKARLDAKEAR